MVSTAQILAVLIGGTAMSFYDEFPTNERRILMEVAENYQLDAQEAKLLFIIRKIENGREGCEMGVEVPRAMRFAGDFEKSLRLQACYAAGTIKKRYTGDIKSFSRRWCPVNCKVWFRMARSMMQE